jgi:hypothetical protein
VDINKTIESLWTMLKPQIATTIRGGFKVLAGMLGTWGALKDPGSQAQFIDLGTALILYLIGQGWSWWQASGQDLVKAQMEIFKAKTFAQAQKIRLAGLPPVTVKEIAQQSNMTLAETVKVIPTLPTEVQANIAPATPNPTTKVVALIAIMIASMFLAWLHPASAQTQKKTAAPAAATTDPAADAPSKTCLIPWDPLKLCGVLTGNPADDFKRVVKRIQAVGKTDMIYAALKAKNANTPASLVRLQCLNGVLDMKAKFEDDLKDASGTVVPRPDPDAITVIEETAELVDALAPQGALFTSCAGAAQLFKTSTLAAINGIVTGAVGLVAMGG